VGAIEVVGDDQAEDRIAEELETLVRTLLGVLGTVRAMSERESQQRRVVDVARDPFRERADSRWDSFLEAATVVSARLVVVRLRQAASSRAVT
jgi:hypothetical protein